MTMRVDTDILTYKKWRAVCDDCNWSSPNFEFLSEVGQAMSQHRSEAHQPPPKTRPFPEYPKLRSVRDKK